MRLRFLLLFLLYVQHGFADFDHKTETSLGEGKSGICLVMLVEDNAATIENCLKSVLGVVNCISICDIGSHDESISILNQFMNNNQIPGEIHKDQWFDFGYNRTQAMEIAKKTLQNHGFSLEKSYILMIDPEMQIHISDFFHKESLNQDAYLILEQCVPLGFCTYNIHLLRASLPWQCIGKANEYWSCEQPYTFAELPSLKIEEPQIILTKLERKANLLKEALISDPNNARYLLYLAQTQAALRQYPEAIENLRKYLPLSGGGEETWFCKLMMGQCYEQIGGWDQALYWYLEAFQSNPDRAESLQKVATYYRLRGMNDLACLFAKHGSRIPFHENFKISTIPPLYDYQFFEELSIAAFYTRFREDGRQANLQLMLKKNVPDYIKNQAYYNQLFYIHSLPQTYYIPIHIDLPLIREEVAECYHPMNPTIQKTKEGFNVICRAVNYTQTGAKIFNTIDETGVFRTKNFLCRYDRELNLLSQFEIIEQLRRRRYRALNIEGLDDCRLFEFQDKLWFTCTTNDTNPTGNFQISLCRLASEPANKSILVDKLVPLLGPDPYRCEKNWLPFIHKEQLHVIYSYDPLLIFCIDSDTGQCETRKYAAHPFDLTRFRGSAPPIAWENGYLLLVHEVLFQANYERVYIHRFVFLDNGLNLQGMSDPFYFLHLGVEFCCGMQTDHTDQHLILTIGVEDREAYFCRVPIHVIQSLLKYY